MASRQQLTERDVSGETAQQVGEQALGPALLAAAASVGLSWYYFFLRGDRRQQCFGSRSFAGPQTAFAGRAGAGLF